MNQSMRILSALPVCILPTYWYLNGTEFRYRTVEILNRENYDKKRQSVETISNAKKIFVHNKAHESMRMSVLLFCDDGKKRKFASLLGL